MFRNDDFAAKQATMNLLSHMHSFHTRQTNEAKQERISRMRRARSVPKMEDEEVILYTCATLSVARVKKLFKVPIKKNAIQYK